MRIFFSLLKSLPAKHIFFPTINYRHGKTVIRSMHRQYISLYGHRWIRRCWHFYWVLLIQIGEPIVFKIRKPIAINEGFFFFLLHFYFIYFNLRYARMQMSVPSFLRWLFIRENANGGTCAIPNSSEENWVALLLVVIGLFLFFSSDYTLPKMGVTWNGFAVTFALRVGATLWIETWTFVLVVICGKLLVPILEDLLNTFLDNNRITNMVWPWTLYLHFIWW